MCVNRSDCLKLSPTSLDKIWQARISVLKPEIQSFVAFISRVFKIIQPFVLCQSVPFLVSLFVPENVVRLRQEVQDNIHAAHCQELSVASFVQRFVIYHESQLAFLLLCALRIQDVPAR